VPLTPRRIMLYAGDNDLGEGQTPDAVLQSFQHIVTKMRQTLPAVPLDFISIKPSPARWHIVDDIRRGNALIADYIDGQHGLAYLDVFHPMLGGDGRPRAELFDPDGLHLSPPGYRLWASIVRPYLDRVAD
jgi:lysophospholipase L1-like esterase